eukprot:g47114.t1
MTFKEVAFARCQTSAHKGSQQPQRSLVWLRVFGKPLALDRIPLCSRVGLAPCGRDFFRRKKIRDQKSEIRNSPRCPLCNLGQCRTTADQQEKCLIISPPHTPPIPLINFTEA